MTVEELIKELVEKYGLSESISIDLLSSRNARDIEVVMIFLRRYGHMIRVN